MYVRNRELTGIQLHRFCSELRNWKADSLGADTGIEPEGTNNPRVSGRFSYSNTYPLFAARPLDFYKTHLYFDKPK